MIVKIAATAIRLRGPGAALAQTYHIKLSIHQPSKSTNLTISNYLVANFQFQNLNQTKRL